MAAHANEALALNIHNTHTIHTHTHTHIHTHTHPHTHIHTHTHTHTHIYTNTRTHTHTQVERGLAAHANEALALILRKLVVAHEGKNSQMSAHYRVATISRILKSIGLFCRISSLS